MSSSDAQRAPGNAPKSQEQTTQSLPKLQHSSSSNALRKSTEMPRMLGRRIKNFLRDDLYLSVSYQAAPPKQVSKELGTLEVLAVYHRWLRGVQALLSIVVFVLALMSTPSVATPVNWVIFIVSQLTILVICKTYEVKAQFSGITNVLFEDRNIFTSPHFLHMVAEIIVWNIQTPPIVVFAKTFFNLLNFFMFVRLYSVVLYLNNSIYVYRTFCRSMAAISGLPLSTSFLIRTAIVFRRYRTATVMLLGMWLTIAFMYMNAESASFSDGIWFSFQSLATLGFGDHTPLTASGRLVACFAGVGSFFMIAYTIIMIHALMIESDEEYNIQVLSRCHDLKHQLHDRSAWVIQAAWRLHRARLRADGVDTTWQKKAKKIFLAWKLTQVIAAERRTRQSLHRMLHVFRETRVNPLTGLSSFQYAAYLDETHRAARRIQSMKDVDKVYLALKERDVAASSLTRKDIESIIFPYSTSTTTIEKEHEEFVSSRTLELGSTTTTTTQLRQPAATAEVQALTQNLERLELKCVRLTELVNAMAANSRR